MRWKCFDYEWLEFNRSYAPILSTVHSTNFTYKTTSKTDQTRKRTSHNQLLVVTARMASMIGLQRPIRQKSMSCGGLWWDMCSLGEIMNP
mmetsp:Transcript_18283/g.42083  ORF Transcript_18283/g.42083 Transcript_18283/m.42083 type:complete len:90 (-) Transcript_18283:884-1153(-)